MYIIGINNVTLRWYYNNNALLLLHVVRQMLRLYTVRWCSAAVIAYAFDPMRAAGSIVKYSIV